eukprot:GHVS01042645.1.p1 GENE.GHVS01042645.1~~GHVS01042645.1.p1  ORF type:complete len:104 (+),score=41.21 GHVS01042645.1:30-314(+)
MASSKATDIRQFLVPQYNSFTNSATANNTTSTGSGNASGGSGGNASGGGGNGGGGNGGSGVPDLDVLSVGSSTFGGLFFLLHLLLSHRLTLQKM